jgi:hypothetical protein
VSSRLRRRVWSFDAVSALTEHTGWVIFDPQEDQVVGIADLRARKRVFALFGR